MMWSGSSPLTVVRDGLWGFLLFAGVTWLAVSWSVLRLEPADLARVAGPVILFGALTEAVRALALTRTWGLNAGMAVVFAATGGLLLADGTSSWATPGALVGWFLMVRGAADLTIGMLSRESDRIWGLYAVLGVVEAGVGFHGAGPFGRTAEIVLVVLAGAALLRGIADLVAALRLREASAAARAERLLELPAERAVGVAGYAAGLMDFEEAPAAELGARHRAAVPRASAAGMADLSAPVAGTAGGAFAGGTGGAGAAFHAGAIRPGAASGGHGAAFGAGPSGVAGAGAAGMTGAAGMVGGGAAGSAGAGPVMSAQAVGGGGTGGFGGGSFHDEVLRTTADLDAVLAQRGVTGSVDPGILAQAAEQAAQVRVPDTAEGADLPMTGDGGRDDAGPAGSGPMGSGVAGSGVAGPAGLGSAAPVDWTPMAAPRADETTATVFGGGPVAGGTAGTATGGAATYGSTGGAATYGSVDGGAAYRSADGGAAYGGADAGGFGSAGGAAYGGAGAAGMRGRRGDESSLPLLDPAARAAEAAMPGMDDTSIIARRLMD